MRVLNLDAKLAPSVALQSFNNEEQRTQRRRVHKGISNQKMFNKERRTLNTMATSLKAKDEEHARRGQGLQDYHE